MCNNHIINLRPSSPFGRLDYNKFYHKISFKFWHEVLEFSENVFKIDYSVLMDFPKVGRGLALYLLLLLHERDEAKEVKSGTITTVIVSDDEIARYFCLDKSKSAIRKTELMNNRKSMLSAAVAQINYYSDWYVTVGKSRDKSTGEYSWVFTVTRKSFSGLTWSITRPDDDELYTVWKKHRLAGLGVLYKSGLIGAMSCLDELKVFLCNNRERIQMCSL